MKPLRTCYYHQHREPSNNNPSHLAVQLPYLRVLITSCALAESMKGYSAPRSSFLLTPQRLMNFVYRDQNNEQGLTLRLKKGSSDQVPLISSSTFHLAAYKAANDV
jgi:hypothetical protein